MRVTFISGLNENLASYRYRVAIPVRELTALGHYARIARDCAPGDNAAVFSKHFDPYDQIRIKTTKRMGCKAVFDVCDHHFDGTHQDHYLRMIQEADEVTCSTQALSEAIAARTGRDAFIISDPYEMSRGAARFQPEGKAKLLWFGHPSNLFFFRKAVPELKDYPLTAISQPVAGMDVPITPWSPETVKTHLGMSDIVVIPVDTDEKSQCKSANRLIESVWAGRFVVANPSPSHNEFKKFAFIGGLREGVEWAEKNPEKAAKKIRLGQDYISNHFSPEAIGKLWQEALSS